MSASELRDEISLPSLTWRSWLVLAAFIVTTVFVIRPLSFRVPLPRPAAIHSLWQHPATETGLGISRWWYIGVHMDMKLTPWLVILLLLASTAIRFGDEVVHGFVGGNGIEPYSIVILIFALAYICISLDESGLLSYVAVHVTSRWGHDGRVLLLCFYALSCVMAVITNNDVVVLCLTPIICIFSDTTGANAEPFLIAMFIAANTASMALFIGNPTNIIVAEANNVSFLSYSAWMGLPFLGAAVAGIAVLYLTSMRKIPRAIAIDVTIRPRDMLRRFRQAVLGSVVLVSCLIALSISSFFGVAVWIVTLPFGVAMLLIDAIIDLSTTRAMRTLESAPIPVTLSEPITYADVDASDIELQCAPAASQLAGSLSPTAIAEQPNKARIMYSARLRHRIVHGIHILDMRVPTVSAVLRRLPYGIIPFSLGMFIIVESLSEQGWTPRLAWLLKHMCPSTAAAVFIVGAVTSLACNVLNNLPMAILFSRALQHPIFAQVDDGSRRGAMFALIIGSNVGANFTLVGSLAGLMFQGIASQKKREIGYFTFMRWCAPVMVVQLAVSCAILVAELVVVK
ncbi:hypothetical protein IWW55_000657 [Coemansia sp. RSA 2706]|nr:hypothetical protein IWW55_000657 [Coemansia sp. RSA 2706]